MDDGLCAEATAHRLFPARRFCIVGRTRSSANTRGAERGKPFAVNLT